VKKVIKRVYNVVSQYFIAIYDSGCQISRTSPDSRRVLLLVLV